MLADMIRVSGRVRLYTVWKGMQGRGFVIGIGFTFRVSRVIRRFIVKLQIGFG